MAYWDALKAKWATTSGTNDAQLTSINSEIVTGVVPTTFYFTGDQLLNCLNWTEFATLTAQQRTEILSICSTPGQLQGGATSFIGGMFVAAYAGKLGGPTITSLSALAKTVSQPWWQANGYPTPIDYGMIQTMLSQL